MFTLEPHSDALITHIQNKHTQKIILKNENKKETERRAWVRSPFHGFRGGGVIGDCSSAFLRAYKSLVRELCARARVVCINVAWADRSHSDTYKSSETKMNCHNRSNIIIIVHNSPAVTNPLSAVFRFFVFNSCSLSSNIWVAQKQKPSLLQVHFWFCFCHLSVLGSFFTKGIDGARRRCWWVEEIRSKVELPIR